MTAQPPIRRKTPNYPLRQALALLIVLGLLGGIVYAVLTAFAPVPKTSAAVQELDTVSSLETEVPWPDRGVAGFAIEGLDGVYQGYRDTVQHPIASITKVITALVVLEHKPIAAGESGPSIRMQQRDIDLYYAQIAKNGGVSPIGLGWTFTQRQLIELSLVASSNNYTDSLAIWAFGSESAFLAQARDWLASNGLSATRIVDPSGISDNNVSTVPDLIQLGRLALANPLVAEIVDLGRISVPHIGSVDNTNILLGQHAEYAGIKTGTNVLAGSCLLFAVDFTEGGREFTMIGVVLGQSSAGSVASRVHALYTAGSGNVTELEFLPAGSEVAKFSTAWGEEVSVVTQTAVGTTVYGAEEFSPLLSLEPLQTAAAGEQVGTLSYTNGTQVVQTALITVGEIRGPDLWWRLTNPGNLF